MNVSDIIELMKKSCSYSVNMRSCSWLADVLKSDSDSGWIIIPEGKTQTHNREMIDLKERYSISVMCQLGNIYNETDVRMVLVHFTKEVVGEVFFSIYEHSSHEKKTRRHSERGTISVVDRFSAQYMEYLTMLEGFLAGKIIETDFAEFNRVSIDRINNERMYPKYYTRRAMAVRELLKKEKTVPLSDVAEILRPTVEINGKVGKCVSCKDFKYPFDVSGLAEQAITSVRLQPGDLLIAGFNIEGNMPYLFQGSDEDVYASRNLFVLRAKKVIPEYLFLYLSSDTAKCVFESQALGTIISRLSLQSIREFPVILPKEDDQGYIDDFEVITSRNKRIYNAEMLDRFDQYNKVLENRAIGKNVEKIEDILNIEIVNTIKIHNEDQLRSFLTDDLTELNICYKNKAYKAALILAGSILEAVLIDWISEIKGVDYFENDYIVTDRNGRSKRADLIDYINEIKEIERPKWMEEASKAHEIRKKRNLVHAKLCLSSDTVDDRICREVIGYLRDVLKTRGIK